jgi:phosphate transport system substrate-binding protein
MAEDLDFVPIPTNVVAAIQGVWSKEIKDAGGKPLFTASH